jgi:hypothetical protein
LLLDPEKFRHSESNLIQALSDIETTHIYYDENHLSKVPLCNWPNGRVGRLPLFLSMFGVVDGAGNAEEA